MQRMFGALLIIILAAAPGVAQIYTVYADGSGDYPTIQAAIDAVPYNGTGSLMLGDGVFAGEGNRFLYIDHRDITLISISSDPALCVMNSGGDNLVSGGGESGDLRFMQIGFENCGPSGNSFIITYTYQGCRFTSCSGVLDTWTDGYGFGQGSFYDCVFTECTGLIADNADFYDCEFRDNLAKIGTGGTFFYDSSFIGNSAATLFEYWGGDTYWMGGGFTDCVFAYNDASEALIKLNGGNVELVGCRLYRNSGPLVTCGYVGGELFDTTIHIEDCSFVNNYGPGSYAVGDTEGMIDSITILRSIFASRDEGEMFNLHPSGIVPAITDCDIFGNVGGDWTGPIADQLGVGCNMSENPAFCNAGGGDLTLFETSPCLPENNGCGMLIGAAGQGCGDPTAAAETPAGAALRFAQNHPNPFNPSTRIVFDLAESLPVTLSVHDAAGRRVATLLDAEPRAAGRHAIDWNGRDDVGQAQASGAYFALLEAAGARDEIKMILLR